MSEQPIDALRAIRDNTEGRAVERWLEMGSDPRDLIRWINQRAEKALGAAGRSHSGEEVSPKP